MKNVLLNLLLALIVCSLGVFIYHKSVKKKIGYIEIKKVFNGFQMKKELEDKFKQTTNSRGKIIDSLALNLKLISKQLNEQKQTKEGINNDLAYMFEFKREEFLKLKNQFTEENAALSQKYDGQILEQMTQYIIEFGKANNYEFIFGADGSGNLMYADETLNISDDISAYINNKYKGVE